MPTLLDQPGALAGRRQNMPLGTYDLKKERPKGKRHASRPRYRVRVRPPGESMTAVLRLRSGEGTVAVEWAGAVLAQRMQAGRGMYGPC